VRRSRVVAAVASAVILASGTAVTIALATEGPHKQTAPLPALQANGSELIDGSSVTSPVDLTVSNATDVNWTVDGTFVAEDDTAPFELVENLTAGRHRVSVGATDNEGKQHTLTANFTVSASAPASPTATAPTTEAPNSEAPTVVPPSPNPTATQPQNATVETSAQLVAALDAATPGTTIHLADGVYTADRQITINRSCTQAKPCTLIGGRGAVLDGGGARGHYGLYVQNANYWNIQGLRVTNGSKGIVADNSQHITINNVEVDYIGDEGIHLRAFTSDSIVENSYVHDTGLTSPQYGEGIYVGSSASNWETYSGGLPDASDRNQILNNTIARTSAENIDIKEGTVGGLISGNKFDATSISGQNSADSWVDIKGNGWVIKNNTGTNPTNNPDFRDGFQTHILVSGDGVGNTFSANVANLGKAAGYAFRIQTPKKTNNIVKCDNTVTGGIGLANETCTAA
jgi:Right handed beta helix region